MRATMGRCAGHRRDTLKPERDPRGLQNFLIFALPIVPRPVPLPVRVRGSTPHIASHAVTNRTRRIRETKLQTCESNSRKPGDQRQGHHSDRSTTRDPRTSLAGTSAKRPARTSAAPSAHGVVPASCRAANPRYCRSTDTAVQSRIAVLGFRTFERVPAVNDLFEACSGCD